MRTELFISVSVGAEFDHKTFEIDNEVARRLILEMPGFNLVDGDGPEKILSDIEQINSYVGSDYGDERLQINLVLTEGERTEEYRLFPAKGDIYPDPIEDYGDDWLVDLLMETWESFSFPFTKEVRELNNKIKQK